MKPLINERATKEFILENCAEHRPAWGCDRVADSAFIELNYRLGAIIVDAVKHHPTIGKTFKEV